MKSIFRLSFFVALFALITVTSVAQTTPCVEGTHFTSKVIFENGKPYRLLTFTNTGAECQWSVPSGISNLEYLVVGGGGGGAGGGTAEKKGGWPLYSHILWYAYGGGGGGAGGLLQGSLTNVTPSTTYSILVGTGGAGGVGDNNGATGQPSKLGAAIIANGGGGGGKRNNSGLAGASGGGGGGSAPGLGGSTSSASQGKAGGNSRSGNHEDRAAGGGGGGAGAVGTKGDPNNTGCSCGGNGGAGLVVSITGENLAYAGGGGGGAYDDVDPSTQGNGGIGGGGAGANEGGTATAGTNGFGGGGGGMGRGGNGGAGGSGTVIIRYNDLMSLATTSSSGAGLSNEGNGLFISDGLVVDVNKSLTVEPGVVLVVEGNVVNNGQIILKSNPNGTSYGQLKWSGSYSGSGTVSVEKYLNSDWNLLAVGASGVGPSYFGSVSSDNTKPWEANLYEWSGSNFAPVYNNGTVNPAKGYLAYVGALGVHQTAGIQTYTGSPVTEMNFANALHGTNTSAASAVSMYGGGPLDGGVLDRKGWNLLANPFTSDLRVFDLTRSNLANSYYLRNNSGGYTAVAMAGIAPDVVPPLSAFWVKATAVSAPTVHNGTSGKISFNASLKAPVFAPSTNTTPVLMRTNSGLSVWDKAFVTVTGEITGKGERQSITERGFVYSTSASPTIGASGTTKVDVGSGTGVFSKTIAGLNSGSTYYIRPYATSPSGTSYGTQFTIVTPSTFTCGSNSMTFSYNGSSVTYNTIWLSSTGECWMDRNLGATASFSGVGTNNTADAYGSHYFQFGRPADGHQLQNSTSTGSQYNTLTPSGSSFVEQSSWTSVNLSTGNSWNGLYASANPCPLGWRVPTSVEWTSERNQWSSITNTKTMYNGQVLSYTTQNPADGMSRLKLRMSTVRVYSPRGLWNYTKFEGATQARDQSAIAYNLYPMSYYWSSTANSSTTATVLQIRDGMSDQSGYYLSAILNGAQAGFGAFVRCIRSDGYNTSTQSFD